MTHYVIMELLGTFFLTLAVSIVGEAIPVGLMLMAMIYVGAHISGAHYNPVLSIAAWARGLLKNEELLFYVGMQVAGALMGLWITKAMVGNLMMPELPTHAQMAPFFMEMLLVMVLALVFLTITKSAAYKGMGVQGLVIGFTLSALMAVGGPNHMILNPAIALASSVAGVIDGVGMSPWNTTFVYVVAPAMGGIIAAWIYGFLNETKK